MDSLLLKVCSFTLIKLRYFHQRYKIFSKYDDGIWMTENAWFGVTPEPVAKYVYQLSGL